MAGKTGGGAKKRGLPKMQQKPKIGLIPPAKGRKGPRKAGNALRKKQSGY